MKNTMSAKIAAGACRSNGMNIKDNYMINLQIPATFVGTTIVILASPDGENYEPLYDDFGFPVKIPVAAGRSVSLKDHALTLAPVYYMALQSGTHEIPTNQTADIDIQVSIKR